MRVGVFYPTGVGGIATVVSASAPRGALDAFGRHREYIGTAATKRVPATAVGVVAATTRVLGEVGKITRPTGVAFGPYRAIRAGEGRHPFATKARQSKAC